MLGVLGGRGEQVFEIQITNRRESQKNICGRFSVSIWTRSAHVVPETGSVHMLRTVALLREGPCLLQRDGTKPQNHSYRTEPERLPERSNRSAGGAL